MNEARELYRSSNGDRWSLARDPVSGRVFVRHEANISSGGRVSDLEVGAFLNAGLGPEQQSLLRLIGALIDASAPSGLGQRSLSTEPSSDPKLKPSC